MGRYDVWTSIEDDILCENYKKLTYKQIGKLIKEKTGTYRSNGAIKARACLIGITEEKEPNWTKEEDKILLKYRSNKTYSEISNILKDKLNSNRSTDSIYHRCKALNLERIYWWEKR